MSAGPTKVIASTANVTVHALPPATADRIWLGFCLGFGLFVGVGAAACAVLVVAGIMKWLAA